MRDTNEIHLSYRITVIAINFPHDNGTIDNTSALRKGKKEKSSRILLCIMNGSELRKLKAEHIDP